MVIAIDGKWIWDSWYFNDGQKWHGYFLQADRSLGDPGYAPTGAVDAWLKRLFAR